MVKIISKFPILYLSIFFCLCYWVIESVVHFIFFDNSWIDLLPDDSHELWMRLTVTFLILLFGIVGEVFTKILLRKEMEKVEIYTSMLQANNHILNNFLNKMYLFKMEADESKDFDKEILAEYSGIIDETKAQIKNLEGIEKPLKNKIDQRLKEHL